MGGGFFFFQAEDGIRDSPVTGVQTCALPIFLPDGADPASDETSVGNGSTKDLTPEFSWTAKEAVRTGAFWLLLTITALGTLASSAVGFSLVPFLVEDGGLSTQAAAGVLSLGTFLAVANVFWGYLADHITPRRCLLLMMIGAGQIGRAHV